MRVVGYAAFAFTNRGPGPRQKEAAEELAETADAR